MHLKRLLLSLLFLPLIQLCGSNSDSLKGLYNGLDPTSITEHLALHKLFPNEPIGKQALKDVQLLLSKTSSDPEALSNLPTSTLSLDGFISFMLGESKQKDFLEEEHLDAIERMSSHLANRRLLGHKATSEEEVLKLESQDIDLARALLIGQESSSEIDWIWVRNYEAQLDFMALQVLARLPLDPTPSQIIKEINQLLFFEMRYRFPALSSLKTGDEPFSKLTTVLDSKKGVCLGVSVLYLCLAQRLDLPLEIVIPPGHIFVRHVTQESEINIETTARGINYPSENYLDVNTKLLKKADLKEVIGFIFYNISSSYLVNTKNYPKAIENYLHCLKYAPSESQALELLGYAYVLNGQDRLARKTFKALQECISEDRIASVYLDTPQEYLKNKIGNDAISVIVEQTDDESLTGIQDKQKKLLKIVKKYPHYKAGLFFLSQTYQELSQFKEAIVYLERLHTLDPTYPYVEFSLSNLYLSEYNLPKAWKHFKNLENLLTEHDHHPKVLKEFKTVLKQFSIEP